MTRRSRLAPSPTGALHLGNARTFIINWALARRSEWELLMRVEDLDSPRIKDGAVEETLDLLAWLGLDHDGDVLVQSEDLTPYRDALAHLAASECVFACSRSRKDIEQAASAPHAGDHETPYPRSLRPEPGPVDLDLPDVNFRLRVDSKPFAIHDELLGPQTCDPAAEVGDFIVWTRRGVPAYQLAVVVDDARTGVTDVVRGADLLPSAARQELIYRALGTPPPRWWHVGLVVGPDGRRLAKRHGDTRLSTYREHGVRASRIIGLMAYWCGHERREPMSAQEFADTLHLPRLPRDTIVFTEEDHRWLLHD